MDACNYHEIQVIHMDWKGTICYSDSKNECFRKDVPSEKGTIQLDKNRFIVYWRDWDPDSFFRFDLENNIFIHQILFEQTYNKFPIYLKNKWMTFFWNQDSKQVIIWNEENIKESTILFYLSELGDNIFHLNNTDLVFKEIDLVFQKINLESIMYYVFFENHFFPCSKDAIYSNINLSKEGILQKILLDTRNLVFICYTQLKDFQTGTFKFIENKIILKYDGGKEEIFFSNLYTDEMPLIERRNQIYFHIPKSIIIGHQVLFSNITLIGNKIYCTSIHYKKNPFKIEDIQFFIENVSLIDKKIYHHDHYESSLNIILELDSSPENCLLEIFYVNKKFKVELEQFTINKKSVSMNEITISAMTLFQNDYPLLKRWIKYYIEKGVQLFFLYYNAMCIPSFRESVDFLLKTVLAENPNIQVHITQWNFKYWMNDGLPDKHHHAQTMAINDSLHILKNFSKYTLYNDLDEYFLLKDNKTFENLISENPLVDVFVFKNHFCKMNNELISYNEFDSKFNLSNVILGNYWDSQREKNLIKLDFINVMGVHKEYNRFSNQNIVTRCFGEFLHITNFKEKDREFLMYEYVV